MVVRLTSSRPLKYWQIDQGFIHARSTAFILNAMSNHTINSYYKDEKGLSYDKDLYMFEFDICNINSYVISFYEDFWEIMIRFSRLSRKRELVKSIQIIKS